MDFMNLQKSAIDMKEAFHFDDNVHETCPVIIFCVYWCCVVCTCYFFFLTDFTGIPGVVMYIDLLSVHHQAYLPLNPNFSVLLASF